MQELVERITGRVGLDQSTAERAVAIILHFLKTEAPPESIAALVARMPGAGALLADDQEAPKPAGLIGSIGGLLGGLLGGGMGGIMAAFTMLTDAGLDMGQVQATVREVIAFAREKAGDEPVDAILGSIPGLAQFAR